MSQPVKNSCQNPRSTTSETITNRDDRLKNVLIHEKRNNQDEHFEARLRLLKDFTKSSSRLACPSPFTSPEWFDEECNEGGAVATDAGGMPESLDWDHLIEPDDDLVGPEQRLTDRRRTTPLVCSDQLGPFQRFEGDCNEGGAVATDAGGMPESLDWDHLIEPDDDLLTHEQRLNDRRRTTPLVCSDQLGPFQRFEGDCNEPGYAVNHDRGLSKVRERQQIADFNAKVQRKRNLLGSSSGTEIREALQSPECFEGVRERGGAVAHGASGMPETSNWDHLIEPDDDLVGPEQRLTDRRRKTPVVCSDQLGTFQRFEGVCNEPGHAVNHDRGLSKIRERQCLKEQLANFNASVQRIRNLLGSSSETDNREALQNPECFKGERERGGAVATDAGGMPETSNWDHLIEPDDDLVGPEQRLTDRRRKTPVVCSDQLGPFQQFEGVCNEPGHAVNHDRGLSKVRERQSIKEQIAEFNASVQRIRNVLGSSSGTDNREAFQSPECFKGVREKAGYVVKRDGGMPGALNWDHLIEPDDDLVGPEQRLKDRRRTTPLVCPAPFGSLKRFEGVCNEARHAVSPANTTHFQQVKSGITEGFSDSYRNKPLGKSRHPRHLPDGFDCVERTLGKPPCKDSDLGVEVNPRKIAGQVQFEESIAQDLNLKSHKSYPGVQMNRSFSRNDRFGGERNKSMPGRATASCLQLCNEEPFQNASRGLANAVVHRSHVGKHHLRGDILGNIVPENHSFGDPSIPDETSRELMHSPESCFEKRRELAYMSHINSVRLQLKKHKTFDWFEFLARFRRYDKERTAYLPLPMIFKVCRQFSINLDKDLTEILLLRLHIMSAKTKCVDYTKVYELLHPSHGIPDIEKKIKEDKYPMHSIYNSCYSYPENTGIRAGIPSVGNDLSYIEAPIEAFEDNLGDETTAETLIEPSFYTRAGISHMDLLLPRNMIELHLIFHDVFGIEVSIEAFELLYEEALPIDKTGGVSIQKMCKLWEYYSNKPFNETLKHIHSFTD